MTKNQFIFQVSLGEQKKLYDFCIDSVARYCEKYNIEHRVLTEQVLNICPDTRNTNRSRAAWNRPGLKPGLPIFEKEVAFDIMRNESNLEQCCIIDADIYIRDSAPNIFKELPINGPDVFGGVVEREMPITEKYRKKILTYSQGQYGPFRMKADFKWNDRTGAEFFNMGMMLFNRGLIYRFMSPNESAKNFLMRREFNPFRNGTGNLKWSTDQTLLNYWIKTANIPTKHLNWKWNALFRGIEDKYLPEAHFIHFFLKSYLPNEGEDIDFIKKTLKTL